MPFLNHGCFLLDVDKERGKGFFLGGADEWTVVDLDIIITDKVQPVVLLMHEVARDEAFHHQLYLPAADTHKFIVAYDALGLVSGLKPLDGHQTCFL